MAIYVSGDSEKIYRYLLAFDIAIEALHLLATADREDRLIARSTVKAPDYWFSTIRRAPRTRVSTPTIHRRLTERNLHSYRPLRHLPPTPVRCRARLQWFMSLSGWNHADWGHIVFSDESRFHLCPDDHRRRVWRRPGWRADPAFTIVHPTGPQQEAMYPGLIFQQGNAKPRTTRFAINCLTAYQTLPWPARSPDLSPIKQVWNMMERRTREY
ncbi:transposable element Tc1 transposase [Trichonephila clavipes]|nr:transposable element Tc1 transposase [Trichonephila clavipes]